MWTELPKVVEIEPTYTCNLRCRMCHVSFMPEEPRPVFDPTLVNQLGSLRGASFILGSGFEPMMNRDFASIIRLLAALEAKIEIITNGTLLSADNVSALLDADTRLITFSFDGARADTYEHIRRRSEYGRTVGAILDVRRQFSSRDTYFSVNSTVMRRNLPEVGEMVSLWDEADFDMVRFIAMVVRESDPDLIRESLYPIRNQFREALDAVARDVVEKRRKVTLRQPWFRQSNLRAEFPDNVRDGMVISDNPDARMPPDTRDDQLGPGPGMTFECRSPWSFARILPDGDVQLCNRFSVGNLRTASFEEIWFGERATAVRNRVVAETKICETCDYFRFCLKSSSIDSEAKEFYLSGPLLEAADTIDFEGGMLGIPPPRQPPILVETIGAFNIVRRNEEYLVVPHALGPIDLDRREGLPETIRHAPGLQSARRVALDCAKSSLSNARC